MRWLTLLFSALASVVFMVLATPAHAQFMIVSSTRSLNSSEGFAGLPGLPADISNNDSANVPGTYDNSETSADSFSIPISNGDPPYVDWNANGTASQDSFASVEGLSGSGSASGLAYWMGDAPPSAYSIAAYATATASYDVTFEVPVIESITLGGSIQVSEGSIGPGFDGSGDETALTLSGGGSPLYGETVGFGYPYGPLPENETFSFATTLSPGVSYQLSVSSTADEGLGYDGSYGTIYPYTASFNFSLTAVPEPTSIAITLAAAGLLLRRQRPTN